jgi:hypothetical protein
MCGNNPEVLCFTVFVFFAVPSSIIVDVEMLSLELFLLDVEVLSFELFLLDVEVLSSFEFFLLEFELLPNSLGIFELIRIPLRTCITGDMLTDASPNSGCCSSVL